MNNFSSRIRDIEARMNRAKTLSLASSSSLKISQTEITIPFQIVATRVVSGEVLDCDSSKVAYVAISTANNAPALIAMRLISPTSFGDRIIINSRTLENIGNAKYGYKIRISGDDSDLQALNNGQTLPWENYKFKILATSEISLSIRYIDYSL